MDYIEKNIKRLCKECEHKVLQNNKQFPFNISKTNYTFQFFIEKSNNEKSESFLSFGAKKPSKTV